MTWATTDLCDQFPDCLAVLSPDFRDLGGLTAFAGLVTTVRVRGDNGLVRAALSEPGDGRVLVVDGGRYLGCALVGGQIGALAAGNRWSGVVVWGAVRDVAELAAAQVGVRAVATCPRPPRKTGAGERDVVVDIAGVTIAPGTWLAADADGIIVAPSDLSASA